MNKQKNVPWGLQYKAQAHLAPLHQNAQSWLLDPNSLTAKLKQHCQSFQVEVLFEGYGDINAQEASLLASSGPYWLREVLLYCDERAWVFARSVLPQTSLLGGAAAVSQLSNKPLGELLFTHPKVQRQQLEALALDTTSEVNQQFATQQQLWGRQSRFLLQEDPLIVSEVFLPAAAIY